MSTVLEIKQAVQELPREQYGQFRKWLEDYELQQDSLAASATISQMLDDEDGGENQLTEEA